MFLRKPIMKMIIITSKAIFTQVDKREFLNSLMQIFSTVLSIRFFAWHPQGSFAVIASGAVAASGSVTGGMIAGVSILVTIIIK